MQFNPLPVPYLLMDTTGRLTRTDMIDVYNRLSLRIVPSPPEEESNRVGSSIYFLDPVARFTEGHRGRKPAAILDFARDGSLGAVHFMLPPAAVSMSMSHYLKKCGSSPKAATRKFRGSDGCEYRWSRYTISGQEWSCTTVDGELVAYYTAKADANATTCGLALVIDPSRQNIAVEILASLIIMRHIMRYNL